MSKTKILISIVFLAIVIFAVFKFIKQTPKTEESIFTQDYSNNFLIVYQSKRLGVTTQNTCHFAPYGGIKREMNKINLLRSAYGELLYLDAGNSLAPIKDTKASKQELKKQQQTNKESALYIAKKLSEAGIDALGVGETEVNLGIPYLKEIEEKTSIPLVSSNIKYKGSNKYPFKRYILKTVNNIKFAIISLTDSEFIDDKSIEIQDPQQVIEELVPSLSKDSDFIVLLSQMSVDTIGSIVSKPDTIASKIQIVIASDLRFSTENIFWFNQGKTILANLYTQGFYIGEIEINYKKPFVAFSSDAEIQKNIDKINQLQKIVDNPKTEEKVKKSAQASIDKMKNTAQIAPIPDASTYIGNVSGLDSSYDD